MTEIWRLSTAALAAAIRAREISARDAATAALARLDAVNPAINAVVAHHPEDVLAQADAVDAAIRHGENPGILAGVPVTVKVNVDQIGFANTNGTRLQAQNFPTQNSPVIDNFRKSGAVILGRTNTPAFSLRWFTSNLVHGATKNPRNPALTPGGSSGGAAASLVAGIGHIAHGTDIAGSIRYPAYACGVHGLRPTLGRVPAYNQGPERAIGPQLSAVSGPLARSIADLRLGLAALSGPDPRDPWHVPAPLQGPPYPRRAALILRPGGMAIAPEVEAALRDCANRLSQSGWQFEELPDIPCIQEAADLQARLWVGSSFAPWDDLVAQDGDPGAAAVIAAIKSRITLSPADPDRALMRRAAILREYLALLTQYPVLLIPVSGELPFADNLDLQDPNRVWDAQLTQVGLALTGLPALSISTCLIGATPVGVQLVASRYREDICLQAAEAIEAFGTPASPVDPA